MTAASWMFPRRDSYRSIAGAISEARASTASRRTRIPGCRSGIRSVSSTMDGCSAASPQAVKNTTQPRSIGVPTCQVPLSWSTSVQDVGDEDADRARR